MQDRQHLNLLLVEDSPFDSEMILLRLKQDGFDFDWQCVETEPDFLTALDSVPDIILSDWSLPQFSGLRALKVMQEQGLDIPFLIVSGSIGDEAAVDALHLGIYDYILKDRPERLGQAVRNALEQKRISRQNQLAIQALESSEAELRALFSSMQDVVIVLDREGVYRKIAPTNPDLLIRPAQDLLGKNLRDFFPEEKAHEFIQVINKVLTTNVTQHIEYYLTIREREFWFETSISPMSQDQVVWVARDTSERRLAVQALRESEERYRSLLDYAPIGIGVHSEGILRFINNAGLRLLGAEIENQVIGKPVIDIIHPVGLDKSLDRIQRMKAGEDGLYPAEDVYLKLDGTPVNVEVHAVNIQDKGKPAVQVLVTDITERKRSEATLRLQSKALDSAANAIVITDREGYIQWVNPAFSKLTGYTAEEAIGKNPRLLKSGFQTGSFFKNLWDTILSGQVWRSELVNKRKNGTLYTEEETITPLLDPNGVITHFIAIKQDISDRKKSEIALKQYAQRQEKIAELGRALAATLDLNEIYQIAEQHLKEVIDFSNFGFTLLDAKNELLTAAYYSLDGKPIDLNLLPPLKHNPQESATGRSLAIFKKEPVVVNDVEAKRKVSGGLLVGDGPEPQSALYIPLVAEDQVIGLLDLQSYQKDAYTDKDGEWLSVVANQIAMTIQNARLFNRVQTRMEELTALSAIDSAMTSHLDQHEIFRVFLQQVINRLDVDAVVLLLYNSNTEELVFASQLGYVNPNIKNLKLKLGESLSGKVALEKQLMHIGKLNSANVNLILETTRKENFEDYFGIPLLVESRLIGVLEIFNHLPLSPDQDWMRFLGILAGQAAIVIEHIQLFDELQIANDELLNAYDATIEGWSQAMDLRDEETEGHTLRVTEITLRLAKTIGLDNEEMVHIRRGALLHDIGKLGVPDAILLKAGALTDEEWVVMKKHPELARQMLEKVEYLKPAMDIPYCHHERWDGSGYPRGLKGEEIPLAGRIFAIVDVWDALTSDRPYRSAWSKDKTLQYILEQSGKHFDPQITGIFVEYIKSNNLAE